MRVLVEVPQLVRTLERDEPQIGAQRAFLCGHRPRLQVAIAAARGHHRHLDVSDVV
jgi:hypothetical protein